MTHFSLIASRVLPYTDINMLRYYSLTMLLVASATIRCSAFITPTSRSSFSPLYQSSSSDDDNSSTVNIALIQSDSDNGQRFSTEGFENALQSHPFCKMTGVTLNLSTISVASEFTKEDVSSLQQSDIACFSNVKGVKSYLTMLDGHFNVAEDITDEERRKLPNKPDLVSDIIEGISGAVSEEDGSKFDVGIMAACPDTNTAKECLNSGRWMSNYIYYPKDMQQAVELKTEAIDSESDAAEEEGDIDLEVWAASIVQAAGDAYERKFWGGGW
eukprot:scaffold488_cov109-Skeletonema_dohrnii-CCMP3373.AAC.2